MDWTRSFDDVGTTDVASALNPDSVLETMLAIVEAEKAIGKTPAQSERANP